MLKAYPARWIERDYSAALCRAEAMLSIAWNRCSERDPDPLYKAQKAVEKLLKECQRQATEAVLEQRSTEAGLKASSSIPCACG